jgi:hypothetical protein
MTAHLHTLASPSRPRADYPRPHGAARPAAYLNLGVEDAPLEFPIHISLIPQVAVQGRSSCDARGKNVVIQFEVPGPHGPALKSAVEEMYDSVSERAQQAYSYPQEDALCGALNALGALRAVVNKLVPAADPYFVGRRA